MNEYVEVTGEVEVPKNTGKEGFLKAIKDILQLPRVQGITIDARGRIEYRHYAVKGEAYAPLEVSFDTLQPYAAIRNSTVIELTVVDPNAAIAVGKLFQQAEADRLCPVAFVGGANSRFWLWYSLTTGLASATKEELHGVPFLIDRHLDDSMLVLCAAYTRTAALIDTQRSYKLAIPTGAT